MGRRHRARPSRAATPTRSWPPPPRVRSPRWSSAVSTRTTCADPALAAEALEPRRLRRQPRAAAQRGHRARRRRPAGRPGGREGRPLRQLGGPPPPVRPDDRRAPARCRDGRVLDALAEETGRRSRAAHRRGGARRAGRARRRPPRAPPRRRWRRADAADAVGAGRGGARHLARTASTPGGCRTATRTWPAPRSRCSPASCRRPPPRSGWLTATRLACRTDARLADRSWQRSWRLPDGVVWLPTNARDVPLRSTLGVDSGAMVTLVAADAPPVIGVDGGQADGTCGRAGSAEPAWLRRPTGLAHPDQGRRASSCSSS